MSRTVSDYIEQAMAAFEAGFTSKAGQKSAIDSLNRAAELLGKQARNMCLEMRDSGKYGDRLEALNDAYWLNYDLHVWNAKRRAELLSSLPEAENIANQYDDLAELRKSIKAAPVVKAERKADERETRIIKTIREMMELRRSQYERGLKLHDLFGGLPVHGNVHYVTNQHGTTFLRTYYYLAGTLTPLAVILAVMDTKAREAQATC